MFSRQGLADVHSAVQPFLCFCVCVWALYVLARCISICVCVIECILLMFGVASICWPPQCVYIAFVEDSC
jgi:hypothetical protein